jgi:hypothetical protein
LGEQVELEAHTGTVVLLLEMMILTTNEGLFSADLGIPHLRLLIHERASNRAAPVELASEAIRACRFIVLDRIHVIIVNHIDLNTSCTVDCYASNMITSSRVHIQVSGSVYAVVKFDMDSFLDAITYIRVDAE